MLEMGDSSTENNEFQFYLLLVRQYIFQLPEEDERVRAAAWMVHLRRLRDAKDLQLRNDYIKLLLFAMHSRCLIGPFAQPPQKDKGLEHFPKKYTFPEMMRHLIEESKAQTMSYCQTKNEDQLPFTPGECRVQEKLENTVSLSTVSLTQPETYHYNFENNITPRVCKENIVTDAATASWVSGLTSENNNFPPDLKVDNLTKLKDETKKECQYVIEDASVMKEDGMKSAVDVHREKQIIQDASVSLHNSCERISLNSNSSTCEENQNRDQKIYNTELHENNERLRNSSQFTDTLKSNIQHEINMARYIDGNNINNETYSRFNCSDHSHCQHCHHHRHHKSPVCHNNDQKISAIEMGVTGRKYIGQTPPQIPVNGGMTYAKQDFSFNCGHTCCTTDFRENSTCWLKENAHNNLGTNPLILNYQTDYDRHTTNLCNHQARENCRCYMSNITGNLHSCPLDINNINSSGECRSSAEIKKRDLLSDEIIQKNNVKPNYITGNRVNTTENFEQHKSFMNDSGRIHSLNMKHFSHEEGSKTPLKGQLFSESASELQLPLHATNELSINEFGIRQRKSAQEMHLQGPAKQISHTQTETQENMSSKRRHPQSTEDIPTDLIPRAKNSEFNVAKFRTSLSADLGAYSAGYAAGYSAGYAAGIAAALNSPAEHLYTVLQ